jgi:hypothetical protein
MPYANNDYAKAYEHICKPIATMYSDGLTVEQKSNIIENAKNFLKSCKNETIIHTGTYCKTYAKEELKRLEEFQKRHGI